MPQSVTLGVPLIVNVLGLYVTPFGNLVVSTVTVESIFPVPIRIGEIGVLSTPVCVWFVILTGSTGVIITAGLELGFFGSEPAFCSSVSEIPSPSSSVSVTSGLPSPSVSLCTVISIVLVIVLPSGFVTTTGISNLRDSSVVPQSVTSGVPLIVLVVGS